MRKISVLPRIALALAAGVAVVVGVVAVDRSRTSGEGTAKHPSTELEFSGANANNTKGFEFGFEVRLTDDGPEPRQLLSTALRDVTFRNTTAGPLVVMFDNFTVPGGQGERTDSGEIPPGGTFSFKPAYVGSFHYHLGSNPDVSGNIQADPEDPYDQPGN